MAEHKTAESSHEVAELSLQDVLKKFRDTSFTQKDKGTRFERLMRSWLRTDPRYSGLFSGVWLWEDFPSRGDFGGKDTGIDLVARTHEGDYWAIQCKCYAEGMSIDKPSVDSFLATSSRCFADPLLRSEGVCALDKRFDKRLWISTTNKWGANAEEAIQNQDPQVVRVGLHELEISPVDWARLLEGLEGKPALGAGKQLRPHQLEAISRAEEHFEHNERGKLIMACGTGKTFTSLRMMERLVAAPQGGRGLVLFLVPSIALLGQSLNDWCADATTPIKAVCICSDAKSNRKTRKGAANSDDLSDSIVDLALPASTDTASILRQLRAYRSYEGLVVVFSTYQSIEVVSEAQQQILEETAGEWGTFDFIVCDEAHRTTGVKLGESRADATKESNFLKVHDASFLRARHRLYMTATPRLYGDSAKVKASKEDLILCSMDDETLYGKEFHRVNFAYAVQNGILCDYKVMVLTITEDMIPETLREEIKKGGISELNYDNATRFIGLIRGLSKQIRGDDGVTWEQDPRLMRRALAFASTIDGGASNKRTTKGERELAACYANSSKGIAETFPLLSQHFSESLTPEEQQRTVRIQTRHVDGSMGAAERADALSWLSEEAADPQECRVLTNVRCLSEGVDVPALDAVLFLSSRSSQVDVVQSVGRVMRSFRRGQPEEKKYGYILIPVVIPEGESAEEALSQNHYKVVWDILNALRAHDDHFNALVNSIALNKQKSSKIIIATPDAPYPADAGDYLPSGTGATGLGGEGEDDEAEDTPLPTPSQPLAIQQLLSFEEQLQQGIYAKLVEKCGERTYWENWAKSVGSIAQRYIERITRLVSAETSKLRTRFVDFVETLRLNLNPTITEAQCIEMLAQHLITRPVFEALFEEYAFVKNNSISSSMQLMIELLEAEAVNQENDTLESFYDSVRTNIGKIDNLEGKQTIIKNLYEKFFKGAFPKTVEQLGIVYTPVECVDFILHSVDYVLREDFGSSLSERGVHILDPFTGTGTFITRLLQSGLIAPEMLPHKYQHEIHCNELSLLAYYIADVNIESVFQEQHHRYAPDAPYLPYDGVCLTDTFQLGEESQGERLFDKDFFVGNSEAVSLQKKSPIRIIIGNPPYSIGQKSANDNAQNADYPLLDKRVAQTYAARSSASSVKGIYDSYIRAFRWASDRVLYQFDKEGHIRYDQETGLPAERTDGSIIAFISNGAWIDGNSHDGFRASLQREFDKIYVLNLRGNQRTSGELSRREGGKIFGGGSRTPIAITLLVKYPATSGKSRELAEIRYHDIGDYLKREQKLHILHQACHLGGISDWQAIQPNDKEDWINQRDGLFDTLLPLAPEKKKDLNARSVFSLYSLGVASGRDAWAYNSARGALMSNVERMMNAYNIEVDRLANEPAPPADVDSWVNSNEREISWNRNLKELLIKGTKLSFDITSVVPSHYRPFCRSYLYFQKDFNGMQYLQKKLFPTPAYENLCICVSGLGGTKPFCTLITDKVPDLQLLSNGQCFPLYWYEENKQEQASDLFGNANASRYKRRDGVTDWMLREVRSRFSGARSLTKEDIFYYVYGLLHSTDYRERFADDLRKSLPRIPIVERVEDFMAFSQAGRALAALHLGYESYPAPEGVVVTTAEPPASMDEYDYYRVEKMTFPKGVKAKSDTIHYNSRITITGIPIAAYDYVVNGKSAIDWVIERYQVTTDKNSGIVNDPNAWSQEQGKPRYILDLLLSVIHVSLESQRIIATLPRLEHL